MAFETQSYRSGAATGTNGTVVAMAGNDVAGYGVTQASVQAIDLGPGGGPKGKDLVAVVCVPQNDSGGATTPSLTVLVEESLTGGTAFSTTRTVCTFPSLTAAGVYQRRFAGVVNRYVRFKLTVVSGGGSPNFGTVVCGLELAAGSNRDV